MIQQDTIVALATPLGKSAISLIRISGNDSIKITEKITDSNLCKKTTHTLTHCNVVDSKGSIIDEVLVSIFLAPYSYTKENSTEITCHGSMFIVQKIIERLLSHGARIANPGEFTKRAYLNGRFNLFQAEAIADIINCENERSHKLALNQLHGSLSKYLVECRNELIDLSSLLTLELDFSEENVEFIKRDDLLDISKKILSSIETLLSTYSTGIAIKNGINTVITGRPNVGKSTLLNRLLDYDKAIVSNIPGTTRDIIEEVFYLDGIAFRLIDTAGIRNNYSDEIEKIGINKAKEEIKKATIIIEILNYDKKQVYTRTTNKNHLQVINKSDLLEEGLYKNLENQGFMCISALNAIGIEKIKKKLIQCANNLYGINEQIAINARHYDALIKSKNNIETIIYGINHKQVTDILLEDVNFAIKHIKQVTGEICNEDILNNIFSKFCIGK